MLLDLRVLSAALGDGWWIWQWRLVGLAVGTSEFDDGDWADLLMETSDCGGEGWMGLALEAGWWQQLVG